MCGTYTEAKRLGTRISKKILDFVRFALKKHAKKRTKKQHRTRKSFDSWSTRTIEINKETSKPISWAQVKQSRFSSQRGVNTRRSKVGSLLKVQLEARKGFPMRHFNQNNTIRTSKHVQQHKAPYQKHPSHRLTWGTTLLVTVRRCKSYKGDAEVWRWRSGYRMGGFLGLASFCSLMAFWTFTWATQVLTPFENFWTIHGHSHRLSHTPAASCSTQSPCWAACHFSPPSARCPRVPDAACTWTGTSSNASRRTWPRDPRCPGNPRGPLALSQPKKSYWTAKGSSEQRVG